MSQERDNIKDVVDSDKEDESFSSCASIASDVEKSDVSSRHYSTSDHQSPLKQKDLSASHKKYKQSSFHEESKVFKHDDRVNQNVAQHTTSNTNIFSKQSCLEQIDAPKTYACQENVLKDQTPGTPSKRGRDQDSTKLPQEPQNQQDLYIPNKPKKRRTENSTKEETLKQVSIQHNTESFSSPTQRPASLSDETSESNERTSSETFLPAFSSGSSKMQINKEQELNLSQAIPAPGNLEKKFASVEPDSTQSLLSSTLGNFILSQMLDKPIDQQEGVIVPFFVLESNTPNIPEVLPSPSKISPSPSKISPSTSKISPSTSRKEGILNPENYPEEFIALENYLLSLYLKEHFGKPGYQVKRQNAFVQFITFLQSRLVVNFSKFKKFEVDFIFLRIDNPLNNDSEADERVRVTYFLEICQFLRNIHDTIEKFLNEAIETDNLSNLLNEWCCYLEGIRSWYETLKSHVYEKYRNRENYDDDTFLIECEFDRWATFFQYIIEEILTFQSYPN